MTTTADTDRLVALERRVQELEDKEAIRDVLSRYGFNADLGRSQLYVDLYTEDGVIDLSPTTKYTGRRELLNDFITGTGHKVLENRCLHTSVCYFIRVNGDTAWAEGYSIVFVKDGERGSTNTEYRPFTCGYNHWEFEKKDGQWYLKYRYRRPVGGEEWGGKVIRRYLEG